jgi:serralysin
MGAGDDKLTGGTSVEIVWDEAGNDKYALGGGNDVFLAFGANAEIGTDTIDGGAGIDTYSLVGSNAGVAVNLDTIAFGSAAAKTAIGAEIGVDKLTNIENVFGGGGADTIIGSGAANGLWGDGGGDFLHGRGGNDSIDGGAGSDSIAGGAGRDVLTGGSQDDTFYFTALADSGRTAATRDVITDFEGAGIIGGDKISLAAIDAIAGGADDTFHLLTSPFSEFTGAAGELRYLWTGLETVIQGDVNGDAKADFSIALTGQHILGVDDFNL